MAEEIEGVFRVLPRRLVSEVRAVLSSRRCVLYEIRVKRGRGSTLVTDGGSLPLSYFLSDGDAERLLLAVCDGAIYSKRDGLCRGYIPFGGGVRVGVSGRAVSEGGKMIGVGDVSTLVFRFPCAECSLKEEIYSAWKKCSGGLLIASPPGGGKTTALVSLAVSVAEGERGKRIAIVDERCEIAGRTLPSSVDLLSGYDRRRGIEIAYRTLSAEAIFVDEIATEEEASAVLSALGVGVRVVATAHGDTLSGLRNRRVLSPLFECGMFGSVLIIQRNGSSFSLTEHRICKPDRGDARMHAEALV